MRHILTIGALVALSGCATVQSTHKTSIDTAEGFTYFLPVRHVKLTATKEVLDPPKIKAALDTKVKELDAAKATATAAEQAAKAKAAIVTHLPVGAAASTRTAAVQAVELAQAELAIASAQRDGLASTVAGLKKLLEAALTAPEGSCGYTAKLELLAAQGDRTARFVARPRHNPLRDDTTKLAVTADGLLSSANVVAADRTGDIIVEIAGALGGLGGMPRGVFAFDGGSPAQDCNSARKLTAVFDPARTSEYQRIAKDLSDAGYPLLVSQVGGEGQSAMPDPSKNSWPRDAIFYRTPLPVQVRVSECEVVGCAQGKVTLMEEVLVSVPQAGPISYIPQRSSAFVKTVNDVQFENGVIKSWSADRPSEVLEIVRLPVRIMTALISVPATMLQLRVNHDSHAKSLAETQAAEMAASVKLRILQACLDGAGDDVAAARSCLSK